jgi:hypothetical protein
MADPGSSSALSAVERRLAASLRFSAIGFLLAVTVLPVIGFLIGEVDQPGRDVTVGLLVALATGLWALLAGTGCIVAVDRAAEGCLRCPCLGGRGEPRDIPCHRGVEAIDVGLAVLASLRRRECTPDTPSRIRIGHLLGSCPSVLLARGQPTCQ